MIFGATYKLFSITVDRHTTGARNKILHTQTIWYNSYLTTWTKLLLLQNLILTANDLIVLCFNFDSLDPVDLLSGRFLGTLTTYFSMFSHNFT